MIEPSVHQTLSRYTTQNVYWCSFPNIGPVIVQDHLLHGEVDMKHPDQDRRVRRTHTALKLALIALMEEHPYDSITVQAILDRADVGRSTFYSHFYDKDDVLQTSIREVFEQLYQSEPQDIFPSLILFQHIDSHKPLYHNLARSQQFGMVLKTVETLLISLIDQRLAHTPPPREILSAMVPPFIAGSFIRIVDWWLNQTELTSVDSLNQTFRLLALAILEHGFVIQGKS